MLRGLVVPAALAALAAPCAAQAPVVLPPARTIYQINPLGLLQFGPTFEVQQAVSPSIALNGSVRVVTAGLLSHLMAAAENDALGAAWTVGGSILHYPARELRGWYLGPRVEWGKANTDLGSSTLLAYTGEWGYRFRRPTGFTYAFGMMFGAISDDFRGDDPADDNTSNTAFAALVITLGRAR
jgi:hypothetical protein